MSEEQIEDHALRRRFCEIYEANHASIAAYALRRAATPEDAADVVAETFAVAWRRIRQVPAERAATLWLFGTARRVLANQRRGERRRRRLSLRLQAQPAQASQADGERVGELEVAKAALERLSAEQRDLLGLVAWEGLSTAELAAVLGCSQNAAKIRLHRARRALWGELERAGGQAGPNAVAEPKPAAAARPVAAPKPVAAPGQEVGAYPSPSPMPGETR